MLICMAIEYSLFENTFPQNGEKIFFFENTFREMAKFCH